MKMAKAKERRNVVSMRCKIYYKRIRIEKSPNIKTNPTKNR